MQEIHMLHLDFYGQQKICSGLRWIDCWLFVAGLPREVYRTQYCAEILWIKHKEVVVSHDDYGDVYEGDFE